MSEILNTVSRQLTTCCMNAPRYRVAWLVGPAQRSRKTRLVEQISTDNGWHYLNYTLTPGYFDRLAPHITTYQPSELVAALREWCAACISPVLVVDELDAVLATWDHYQRRLWAAQVARLPYLPCGLVIVSHFFTTSQLIDLLPDHDTRYCIDLSGALP